MPRIVAGTDLMAALKQSIERTSLRKTPAGGADLLDGAERAEYVRFLNELSAPLADAAIRDRTSISCRRACSSLRKAASSDGSMNWNFSPPR